MSYYYQYGSPYGPYGGQYPAVYRQNQYGAPMFSGSYGPNGWSNLSSFSAASRFSNFAPPASYADLLNRPDLDIRSPWNNLRYGDIFGTALRNGWDLNGLGGSLSVGGGGPDGIAGVRRRTRQRMRQMGVSDYNSPFDNRPIRGFGR